MKKILVLGALSLFGLGSSVSAMDGKADQDEQALVAGMERLQLSSPSLTAVEIPESAVKSAVYETNKPTSARLMVKYFDEHIANVGSLTVPAKDPGYTSIFREDLENFTRDEQVSAYHLLPMGLFRCLSQSIPDVEHVAEIVDLDRAIVRDMLHTLESGNELNFSSSEIAAFLRLERAREFIQEARGDA